MPQRLLENAAVRLTTVAVVTVFLAGLLVSEVRWRTNLSRDVQEIRQDVAELKAVIQPPATSRMMDAMCTAANDQVKK